jgi:predicted RNase H-like HicB family nuclease
MVEKYLIVIEKSATGYSVYSPDVFGCIATGSTIQKAIVNMKLALSHHLQEMIKEGEAPPKPRGVAAYLDAVSQSEGEEYLLTLMAVENVLPEKILA